MEDYELSDESCPKCGHSPTHTRDCNRCEEGEIDVSEDNYEPEGTSFMNCSVCLGKGYEHWCPECGHDLI